MHQELETWERVASVTITPGRRKTSAAPKTPAARLIEIEQENSLLRQYLSGSCAEIRRLEQELSYWRSEHLGGGLAPR